MPRIPTLVALRAVSCLVLGADLGRGVLAAESPGGAVPPGTVEAVAGAFSPAQLEFVGRRVMESVPDCPAEVSVVVARMFLEHLQQKDPDKLAQLLTGNFAWRSQQSTLLRLVGAQLNGLPLVTLREEVARRRLQAELELEAAAGGSAGTAARDSVTLLAKIKELSPVYLRRLVEGRTEDDELRILLKKVRQSEAGGKPAAAVKPREMTAAEIVSNFTRHNQEGSSLQRLRAYVLEGRMTAAGDEQQITLCRLRPDRFRLVVGDESATRLVLAFDGQRYWRQAPAGPPMVLKRESMGPQRHLGEFIDGLFGEAGATFERLDDGKVLDRPVFRLAVRRPDGSRYVARLDQETYRQVGRENDDKSTATYSDFRDVAGVMIAFREEVTDAEGRKSVLTIARITPNPAVILAAFAPPPPGALDFFALEGATRASARVQLK